MNDGRIEHLGTPRDIYERPANCLVAGFIGTSNLLSGTVGRVDDGRAVIVIGPGERIIMPVDGNGVALASPLSSPSVPRRST